MKFKLIHKRTYLFMLKVGFVEKLNVLVFKISKVFYRIMLHTLEAHYLHVCNKRCLYEAPKNVIVVIIGLN